MSTEDELLRLLDDAADVVAGYEAMNLYCGFDTGAEFAAELRSLRERVARQDWSALGPVVGIFAPTGAWDDGVGAPGMDLANRVMAVLDQMKWSRRTALMATEPVARRFFLNLNICPKRAALLEAHIV